MQDGVDRLGVDVLFQHGVVLLHALLQLARVEGRRRLGEVEERLLEIFHDVLHRGLRRRLRGRGPDRREFEKPSD